MKKKEIQQLKTKPEADLVKSLAEHREKLWSLRTDLAAGKVKNVEDIKNTRKMIARLMTFINQK